jgi:hypothetical protein
MTAVHRGWGALSLALAATVMAAATARAETTLRVVMNSDLKIVDPIWTTVYVTRNHGYMIYDTLFALDERREPKPQMVDTYSVSDDGLIVLRQKFRRRFPLARGVAQQGHRGNARAMPAMRRRRMLAMELATCRSGRSGGASGSVTRG